MNISRPVLKFGYILSYLKKALSLHRGIKKLTFLLVIKKMDDTLKINLSENPDEEKSKRQSSLSGTINKSMIRHAGEVAKEIGAKAVLVYVDLIKSREDLDAILNDRRFILAARSNHLMDELHLLADVESRIIQVPYMKLRRYSQIKVAAMIALSERLINRDDLVVCLSGLLEYGLLDNLAVLDLKREFEMLSSGSVDIIDQMEKPEVFERLLTLVLELAAEGKEGRPLGAIFVLGDHEKVMNMSHQMIINPFPVVPEHERNILDPALKETLREFSAIDGAFIVRKDGVVLSAGRHLAPSVEMSELPQGLGARHRSAAGITALTDSIAFVISESTGAVRIFSHGKLYMEIEKAK